MSEPLIEFRAITKVYGSGSTQFTALRGVDFSIEKGSFVAIMGPSGSGKSTVMNILGCLDVPTTGSYQFKGLSVETLNRNQMALLRRYYIGFVFQGFNLLSRTPALENVELPLLYRGIPRAQRHRAAMQALEKVGLKGWETHASNELSGGQQQRVAIARALVTDPQILLADEPTGNLDTHHSQEIMELLEALNRELGVTIVMVTHEPDMAAYASRLIHFVDGRVDDNPPKLPQRPESSSRLKISQADTASQTGASQADDASQTGTASHAVDGRKARGANDL